MPNPENVLPHKFKPGQSGNPKGRPKNRALEVYANIVGKAQAKKFEGLSDIEIRTYDNMLEGATMDVLQLYAKADGAPMYLKTHAIAILTDMKNGTTKTMEKVRERLHGKVAQRMEVVGADGQPLIQERNLSAQDVAEIMKEYDKQYKSVKVNDGE